MIHHFSFNPLQTNCYIFTDAATKQCAIIDCGAYYPEEQQALFNYIHEQQLQPIHLLATHGHFDHNFGNAAIFREYALKVELFAEDRQLVEHLPEQVAAFCGIRLADEQIPTGTLLHHGDVIRVGNLSLQVIHTPGHSQGSCVFYCPEEHTAFTGDTLFRMSIGRTDFPESSWTAMQQSLTTLTATLPSDTILLPGHGPQSTMSDEFRYNPYLRNN